MFVVFVLNSSIISEYNFIGKLLVIIIGPSEYGLKACSIIFTDLTKHLVHDYAGIEKLMDMGNSHRLVYNLPFCMLYFYTVNEFGIFLVGLSGLHFHKCEIK